MKMPHHFGDEERYYPPEPSPVARLDAALRAIISRQKAGKGDMESDHAEADNALLEYIDDDRVTSLFNAIRKWYA